VDFVFVASSKAAGANSYGEIDVFEVNSESGHMRQIPTSPFPSGGRNPVAEAVSSDNTTLYVVNHDDNSIVQFTIGSDGKVYPQNTVNTPGIFPVAAAVNGSNLFVVDTYQPLPSCSSAAPCSGSVAVLPIGSADQLGTPVANGNLNYWPLSLPSSPKDILLPTGVNVLASGASAGSNEYAYVSTYDTTTNAGYIFGFWVTPSGTATAPATAPVNATCPPIPANSTTNPAGTLCPLNGGVPFVAGTNPSSITSDATGAYVYVTDYTQGKVWGYSVASASGDLAPLNASGFVAGDEPMAMVVDPSGKFAYVANSLDSNLTAYTVSGGALTFLGTYATGTQPVAIGIDPSAKHFLYTANFLGNTVSGFELSTVDGTLLNSQYSPFTANAQPTAIAAIPHGSKK
jgi:6-phosphogluconolactonase (cycloisomerase 2 family)